MIESLAAKKWDSIFIQNKDYKPVSELLLRRIITHAKSHGRLQGSRNALDLGCGTGDMARKLSALGFHVTALDISSIAIEKAKSLSEPGTIKYRVADIENDELPPSQDLITMKLVFAFIRDKRTLLNRIKAAMSEQGVFVLMAPILLQGEIYSDRITSISQPQEELETLLKSVFEHVELFSEQYFEANGLEAIYLIY